jgi:hypothetical protein
MDTERQQDPLLEAAVRRLMIANYIGFALWAVVIGTLMGLGIQPALVLVAAVVLGLGESWLLSWRRSWWGGVDLRRVFSDPAMVRRYRWRSIAVMVGCVVLLAATGVIVSGFTS